VHGAAVVVVVVGSGVVVVVGSGVVVVVGSGVVVVVVKPQSGESTSITAS
jgi:hypothetical protein